ncbi:hypothetical protein Tco_0442128 [Tanacetum coccineum]
MKQSSSIMIPLAYMAQSNTYQSLPPLLLKPQPVVLSPNGRNDGHYDTDSKSFSDFSGSRSSFLLPITVGLVLHRGHIAMVHDGQIVTEIRSERASRNVGKHRIGMANQSFMNQRERWNFSTFKARCAHEEKEKGKLLGCVSDAFSTMWEYVDERPQCAAAFMGQFVHEMHLKIIQTLMLSQLDDIRTPYHQLNEREPIVVPLSVVVTTLWKMDPDINASNVWNTDETLARVKSVWINERKKQSMLDLKWILKKLNAHDVCSQEGTCPENSSNCLCEELRSNCDREHSKVVELEAEILKKQQMLNESEKCCAFIEKNHSTTSSESDTSVLEDLKALSWKTYQDVSILILSDHRPGAVLFLYMNKVECKKLKKEFKETRFSNTLLHIQKERVEGDLYWTRVQAHEFYREMIRRGIVFKERSNEAIDVPVEDEESPSSEPLESHRDS